MGFLDKLKGLVGQHDDKVDEGLDKAAELAKDHVPDEHDDKVDMAVDKAKDLVDQLDGDDGDDGDDGGGEETSTG